MEVGLNLGRVTRGAGCEYNQNTLYVCMKDSKLINAILTSSRDEGGASEDTPAA